MYINIMVFRDSNSVLFIEMSLISGFLIRGGSREVSEVSIN